MKRIIIHPEKCYGCMTCEAACVTVHKNPGAPLTTEAIMRAFTLPAMRTTRIWVEALPGDHAPVPVTCRHCLDPACVAVCSVGALQQEGDDQAVINDLDRCAGCWMCVMVCPFGGVDKCGRIALKCDLCQGRRMPACVEACPNGALEWVEVEPLAAQRRSVSAEFVARRDPTCGT